MIHLGHNRSVDEIVTAAVQEDVQGIAISSYQGGHVEFFKYVNDLLEAKRAGHVKIFGGGGGMIVPREIDELQSYGVDADLLPEDGRRLGLAGMIDEMMMRCDVDLAPHAPTRSAAIRGAGRAGAVVAPRPADHAARERRRGERPCRDALRAGRRSARDAGRRHHRHRRRREVVPSPTSSSAASARPRTTGRVAVLGRPDAPQDAAARCSATASG